MPQFLLTLDTSGKNGFLALAEVLPGENPRVVVAVPRSGGTFSAELVPQISTLLAKHGFTKSDLAGFAVISGPGSFTGLRIGLAVIKGLAEALERPIAAVSLLEALARSASSAGRVLAVIDAGRSQLYGGDYELMGMGLGVPARKYSERLLTRDQFRVEAKGKLVVTAAAALAGVLITAGMKCEHVTYPDSQLIARLGWQQIERGQVTSPDALEANYVRCTDAEIFSHPKP